MRRGRADRSVGKSKIRIETVAEGGQKMMYGSVVVDDWVIDCADREPRPGSPNLSPTAEWTGEKLPDSVPFLSFLLHGLR